MILSRFAVLSVSLTPKVSLFQEPRDEEEKVPLPRKEILNETAMAESGLLENLQELGAAHPDNICLQSFDAEYFRDLDMDLRPQLLRCMNSGVTNPDSKMGCYACQPEDYDRFKPFFAKALSAYHGVEMPAMHTSTWDLSTVEGLPEDGVLDLGFGHDLSMRVRVGRNLAAFPLPGSMDREQRLALEAAMLTAFEVLIAKEGYGGRYVSITPDHPNFIDAAEYDELVARHIMFKDMSSDKYLQAAGIASEWPHGRGCYISEDEGFLVWVGEEDHLRIMCMQKGQALNTVFERLRVVLETVEGLEGLGFARTEEWGYVTSCPTNIGTGMRASVHVALPYLAKSGGIEGVEAVAKPLGLSVRGLGGEHTAIGEDGTVDISPSARFCVSEAQIIGNLYKGVWQLSEAEANAKDGPEEDGAAEAEPAPEEEAPEEAPEEA